MTVSYDEFFEWMKKNCNFNDIRVKQDPYPVLTPEGKETGNYYSLMSLPMSIVRMEYRGLEKLVKKALIVGGISPVDGNEKGIFTGLDYSNAKQLADLQMVQVFSRNGELSEGQILPLVARIRKINAMRYVEYCPGSREYLGF